MINFADRQDFRIRWTLLKWAARNDGVQTVVRLAERYANMRKFLPGERRAMWALFMSNAAAAAGITISILACWRALRWAGSQGRFEDEKEALNDQEVWSVAWDEQQKMGQG